MRAATTINGLASKYWVRCAQFRCKTFYDTSVPMPQQVMVATDPHERLGVFGGYGSSKTFTTFKCDEKHILITPRGETLVGANTLVQLENTIKKDFESDFPIEFVKHYSKQKNKITFQNGHILYYRHLADEGDLRSYNLTRAHFLEASEVKHDSFIQIQSRVRNEEGIIPEVDENGAPVYEWNEAESKFEKKAKYKWLQIVIESNPDAGWIKSDFLLKSNKITVHHEADQNYNVTPADALKFQSSHIIPTKANYHLPADFARNLAAGKPDWWIKRFIYGSFEYSEGLVYPHLIDNITPDFKIPDHWQRIIGFDYGLNDNSHFIYAAVDWYGENEITGRPAVFFYNELVRNDTNIKTLARDHKQELRAHVPAASLYKTPVMDAKSFGVRTRTGDKSKLGKLFRDEGVIFKPAQMDLDARVLRLNYLIENKILFFFDRGVSQFIAEGKVYKFPEKKLEKTSKRTDKPEDKNNHGINAGEFIGMELPRDMKPYGNNIHKAGRDAFSVTVKPRGWDPLDQAKELAVAKSEYEGFSVLFDEL